MKTEWDYTDLAEAYLKRPDYSREAIDKMLAISGIQKDQKVCDVGAGVAHLTLQLADRGLSVTAVEPNDAMRERGIQRTRDLSNVTWYEGTGEQTGQQDGQFDLVTYGSSFNVMDRIKAMHEAKRISTPGAYMAAMWNHRDLEDPIQKEIETIIKSFVGDYNYGTRREDQSEVIANSDIYSAPERIEGGVLHQQTKEDIVEAWRSHATLHRQAGNDFGKIIDKIDEMLRGLEGDLITIPYVTRIWVAPLK